ncbi:MAG: sigma-54-dependent Fis family transcriptional regulator [Elusimicrobia bacterium]|nr:sigma-54-dependent Fis family transcriptional regulator [Elusimicrobiota bacterium]
MSSNNRPQILVVDDEPNVGMIFHRILGEAGYDVVSASNGMECLRSIKKQDPHLIFLDIRMPGIDGVETLRRIRETHPILPVVIMTAYQTVTSAVECMKLGAYDYLIKPLDADRLKSIVKQVLEIDKIAQKTPQVRQAAEADKLPIQDVVAEGLEMKQVIKLVGKVAPTDLTVLILGESGTGKEVTARAIHHQSKRNDGPFVVVDCAALPESLIESELFGFEKGAFTGADSSRAGKFESANKGTLFLDEIGNLPLTTQAKLLRFLQEPTIERLGSRKGPITLDVRILAATNVNLERAVQNGTFREDLFHRLKVFLIELPPLRSRSPEDLERLVSHTLDIFRRQLGKETLIVAPETFQVLKYYRWPGNIRELQNAMRSAALLAEQNILPTHLPMSIQSSVKVAQEAPKSDSTGLGDVIKRVEREHILETLKQSQWDLEKTSDVLKLDISTLEYKMKNLGIRRPEGNP